jgi:hypothetical protein
VTPTPAQAEWTVLVFLNGDNSLEPMALDDFKEMARVGSSDRVHVVAQVDLNGGYAASPPFTQTLRFHVEKDMPLKTTSALADLGEQNMGDGRTLKEFVRWGKQAYPAKRYMLVIWDHGDGFRANLTHTAAAPLAPAGPGLPPRVPTTQRDPAANNRIITKSGTHRAISSDDTNGGDKLYNREIQDALAGERFDVIGFDACLMSMLETAYAMRELTPVMVASEELEPGPGWQYDDWLGKLRDNPTMSGRELGKVVVESYARRYGPAATFQDPDTTLAAVDLTQVSAAATAVSRLADRMSAVLAAELANIKAARGQCQTYGGTLPLNNVDFPRLCEQLAARVSDAELKQRATEARAALLGMVIANYAHPGHQGNFGSNGLAIFFPESGARYNTDPFEEGGYQKANTYYPIQFVQDHRWADFLAAWFAAAPN